MRAKFYFFLLGLFVLNFLSACGSGNLGRVKGTVTLDGQPLKGASVEFQPKEGKRPSVAVTDANGRYILQYTVDEYGAEIGEHLVQINLEETIEKDGEEITLPNKVPAKYNAKSELVREVKPGSNVIDFDLKTK